MPAFDFNSNTSVKVPSGRQDSVVKYMEMNGLDLTTPNDLIEKGRTPYAKNFRLMAQQRDSRQVAVSSRKGPGEYIDPLVSNTLDSNWDTFIDPVLLGNTEEVHAQPFQVSDPGRITRIDIDMNKGTGNGPIVVSIYEADQDTGGPGLLLGVAGIDGATIGESSTVVEALFLEAPLVSPGVNYWMVLERQDDGSGFYELNVTDGSGFLSFKTNSGLMNLEEQTYSLIYSIYGSTDMTDKGAYRFNRESGINTTLVAYGTSMYITKDTDGVLLPLLDGLSPAATDYSFGDGDGAVFWVNGYDKLTRWNGVHEFDATNLVTNPEFTTNTTGWTATDSATIARSTSEYDIPPASLSITKASGVRGARTTVALTPKHRYRISYWVKGAATTGNTFIYANGPNANVGSVVSLTTSWQQVIRYYTPATAVTSLDFKASSDNIFIDGVRVVDTGIEFIEDPQLPILAYMCFHKDRIFGIDASDRNKLVWSEAPGNPSDSPTNEQWYRAWKSTSFWYIPRPKNGSPVTWFGSFQDSLIVMTQDKKYVFSGFDSGNFYLRESTGSKGALSFRGVTMDENNIYFVSDDGFYEFNGSQDVRISNLILPLFDACPLKEMISPVSWKGQVRFYMASEASAYNDMCSIYEKDMKEWLLDTGTFINRALYYTDSNDDEQLAEFSSLYPAIFYGEVNYDALGGPIDFEYRLKYDSMGNPAMRKRIKKYFPILQGVDTSFPLTTAMDKDFQNSPRMKQVTLTTNGALIGEFNLDEGVLLDGGSSFKRHRQSYSGYASYWQFRISRNAIRNRVAFIGAQFTYKQKRL